MYYKLNEQLLKESNISNNAKLLYTIIYSLSGSGDPFASNYYFSEILHLSIRQIQNLLKELKDNNYISLRYENKKTIRYIKPLYTFEVKLTEEQIELHEKYRKALKMIK